MRKDIHDEVGIRQTNEQSLDLVVGGAGVALGIDLVVGQRPTQREPRFEQRRVARVAHVRPIDLEHRAAFLRQHGLSTPARAEPVRTLIQSALRRSLKFNTVIHLPSFGIKIDRETRA